MLGLELSDQFESHEDEESVDETTELELDSDESE